MLMRYRVRVTWVPSLYINYVDQFLICQMLRAAREQLTMPKDQKEALELVEKCIQLRQIMVSARETMNAILLPSESIEAVQSYSLSQALALAESAALRDTVRAQWLGKDAAVRIAKNVMQQMIDDGNNVAHPLGTMTLKQADELYASVYGQQTRSQYAAARRIFLTLLRIRNGLMLDADVEWRK